jgi:hypothetical protein
MRKLMGLALGMGMMAAMAAAPAQAFSPASSPVVNQSPAIQQVADGCGPGYFRGPRGFCRPAVVAACPWGFHYAPYYGRCIAN